LVRAEFDRPREKPLRILHHGWELNPGLREDRQLAIPLSFQGPGYGENRQRDASILPLSYHEPGHGVDRQ